MTSIKQTLANLRGSGLTLYYQSALQLPTPCQSRPTKKNLTLTLAYLTYFTFLSPISHITMKTNVALKWALAVVAVLSGAPTVEGHSWVEQLQRIAKNGTMINPLGYQRAYVGRDDPGFKGDISDDLWQIPPNARPEGPIIYANDSLCSPQQKIGAYTSKYPQLVTAPGDYIALRHQENGHVSLPTTQANKPRNRGTIYIYGTEKPQANDALLSIHNVWTADGTGGDGRGRLLATRNYDDGQCYQVNSGDISTSRQKQFSKVAENPMGGDLWCQADLQLPTDVTVGANYTIYWVWDWPTLSEANAMIGDAGVNVSKPEIYTSCMDVKIVDACSDELGETKSPACGNSTLAKSNIANTFAKKQSYNAASVPQELTGNFAVSVEGAVADSGSNDGLSAPPSQATGGSGSDGGSGAASTATASTFQTVTTSAGKGGNGQETGKGQETVTIALSTVYVTQVSFMSHVLTTSKRASANNSQGVTTVTVTAATDGAQAVQTSTPTSSATLVAENSDGSVVVQTVGVAPSVTPFMNRKRSRIEYYS